MFSTARKTRTTITEEFTRTCSYSLKEQNADDISWKCAAARKNVTDTFHISLEGLVQMAAAVRSVFNR